MTPIIKPTSVCPPCPFLISSNYSSILFYFVISFLASSYEKEYVVFIFVCCAFHKCPLKSHLLIAQSPVNGSPVNGEAFENWRSNGNKLRYWEQVLEGNIGMSVPSPASFLLSSFHELSRLFQHLLTPAMIYYVAPGPKSEGPLSREQNLWNCEPNRLTEF